MKIYYVPLINESQFSRKHFYNFIKNIKYKIDNMIYFNQDYFKKDMSLSRQFPTYKIKHLINKTIFLCLNRKPFFF